ncbi:MAG: squalene/phytoene synthase family protein [Rickettsiales bacterium]|nr:squalene/phytoene synthase family protein [Rickettsiales bacterium]
MSSSNLQIILKELKQSDYNSYLCATFSLREDLEKVAAILLLQNELKKIFDIASEDMVGMVRIAWWRENLEEIFLQNKKKNHHLLEVIYDLKNDIDYDLLKQALEGFESDFNSEKKFKNKAELEEYIFKTREIFFLIILRLLNFRDEFLGKELARNLAIISFYFDLLQKIKNEDEKVTRFFYDGFFSELKIEAKFWQENNINKKYDENLLVIVEHVVTRVEEACNSIDKIRKSLPKNLKNLITKKDLAEILLCNLRKKNFDIFTSDLLAKSFVTKIRLLL